MEKLKEVIDVINEVHGRLEGIKNPANKVIALKKIDELLKAASLQVDFLSAQYIDEAWVEICYGEQAPLGLSQPKAMSPGYADKDEIKKTMKKMRKKGATYKEIAQFLNNNNIPTFSARGGWHAQSVHRLLFGRKKK